MAEEQDRASRQKQPTQRRLEEARRKGDVAKSPDLAAFIALSGRRRRWWCSAAAGWRAPWPRPCCPSSPIRRRSTFERPRPRVSAMRAALMAAAAGADRAGGRGGRPGSPATSIQHGLFWAPSKLAPEFSKLDPIAGPASACSASTTSMNFLKSPGQDRRHRAPSTWMVLKPRAAMIYELPALTAGGDPAAVDRHRARPGRGGA